MACTGRPDTGIAPAVDGRSLDRLRSSPCHLDAANPSEDRREPWPCGSRQNRRGELDERQTRASALRRMPQAGRPELPRHPRREDLSPVQRALPAQMPREACAGPWASHPPVAAGLRRLTHSGSAGSRTPATLEGARPRAPRPCRSAWPVGQRAARTPPLQLSLQPQSYGAAGPIRRTGSLRP